ncbi:MAG: redoxin protein [Patescibacteria group bacterium]|nr:redoxin protein [Patescibacteria group bacterium]
MEIKSLKIGDVIPDLTLKAYYNDKEIELKSADYRGKWLILFFYPADFTFVCPTELEELAMMYPEFQKQDAEIMSVSCDTVFVHKAWHDNSPAIGKITFPMVSDPTGELSTLFGAYIPKEGLSLRGTFIIDPDGILKTIEINDNSIGRSGKELLRKLRAAKFIRDNHGLQVCPASWEPGDDTLTPGMDLVGKI